MCGTHASKIGVVHCHSLDSSTKAGDLPLVTSSDPYRQRVAGLLCGAKDEMRLKLKRCDQKDHKNLWMSVKFITFYSFTEWMS